MANARVPSGGALSEEIFCKDLYSRPQLHKMKQDGPLQAAPPTAGNRLRNLL